MYNIFDVELDMSLTIHDALLSPLLTSPEILKSFPACTFVSSDVDPCLDETVALSSKLVKAGAKVLSRIYYFQVLNKLTVIVLFQVKLEVLNGLPHGFLSLANLSKECHAAVSHLMEKIRDIILS